MEGIRRAIFDLDTYSPGKPIDELRREVPALARRRIIKLASNENPLGPSPKALTAIIKLLHQIHLYPEPTAPLLRTKLAQLAGILPEQILAGSGADEILRLVTETVVETNDPCVISRLAFSRFRQHVRLMGGKVIEAPTQGYGHDFSVMARLALEHRAKAVFIANPNNPTGTFNPESELKDFFERVGRVSAPPWVILDEAYGEFARDAYPQLYPESLPRLLIFYPKLIVIRTFSKISGLAGLRVGWAAANENFLALVNRARLIFNVNLLGQAAALAALEDRDHVRKTLKLVREGRQFLEKELMQLGFEPIRPSAANFICARIPHGTGQFLYQSLLQEGVIIRAVGEPELQNFVRITIGTLAQNRALLAAIRKVLPAPARV